jgi:hypothetical protein
MKYDEKDTLSKGSINVENDTVLPIATDKAGVTASGWWQFGDTDKAVIQMVPDISANITWTLQVSLDRTNWATAKDAFGDDITGTLVDATPTIEILNGKQFLFFRVSLTVVAQTGTVAYIIRGE